ncbi:MAG: glycosyltransferase [Candidatus Peribacteria bacterium]|nr:MAG: glycosyltransferase [Candidatus Peribacteria bacterium]
MLIQALQQLLSVYPEALFVANITASRGRDKLIRTIKKQLPQGSYHIETGMDRDRLQALVMAADVVVVPSLSE